MRSIDVVCVAVVKAPARGGKRAGKYWLVPVEGPVASVEVFDGVERRVEEVRALCMDKPLEEVMWEAYKRAARRDAEGEAEIPDASRGAGKAALKLWEEVKDKCDVKYYTVAAKFVFDCRKNTAHADEADNAKHTSKPT